VPPNRALHPTDADDSASARRVSANVRATRSVARTAPRLSPVVRDAKRVPNQRLHRTAAAQPPVAPRLPVSRGAVRRIGFFYCRLMTKGTDSHIISG